MKKITLTLLLFLFTTFFVDIPCAQKKFYATIASFNSLHLGWKGKNRAAFAKVINAFDLIALQEVMSRQGIEDIVEILEMQTFSKWEYCISPYPVGTKRYKEYYAFIWNKETTKLVQHLFFFPEENEDDFIREPYGAMFKINKFDFILVNCHLIFGKRKSQRRAEAKLLSKVYDYFQSINNENDIIICGDFNLPGNDKSFSKLRSHPDMINYAIRPFEKTTLNRIGKKANSYDNFFYSKYYSVEVFTGAVYNYSSFYYSLRKTVSDHLPIYLVVDTSEDDD